MSKPRPTLAELIIERRNLTRRIDFDRRQMNPSTRLHYAGDIQLTSMDYANDIERATRQLQDVTREISRRENGHPKP